MHVILEPGMTLPNGARVMLFHHFPEQKHLVNGGVVLAYNGEAKEFATWLYVMPQDKPAYCTAGYYFRDYIDAIADYLTRTGQMVKMTTALKLTD